MRAVLKEVSKAQCGVAGDGALAIQDFRNAIGGHVELSAEFGGAQAARFELLSEVTARMNGCLRDTVGAFDAFAFGKCPKSSISKGYSHTILVHRKIRDTSSVFCQSPCSPRGEGANITAFRRNAMIRRTDSAEMERATGPFRCRRVHLVAGTYLCPVRSPIQNSIQQSVRLHVEGLREHHEVGEGQRAASIFHVDPRHGFPGI